MENDRMKYWLQNWNLSAVENGTPADSGQN